MRQTPVPEIPALQQYVRDRRTLVILGKALFWDLQVGADGRTACATCHFHAGADHRVQNQLSDTHDGVPTNHRLTLGDFPVDSSVRVGSAGVVHQSFANPSSTPGTRQVTPRNTPSVINAIFNVRNFRDGRASDIFTGRTPFGDSDPAPNLLTSTGVAEYVRLTNASLASLAVGPPVNTTEMSFEGRTWEDIARQLLPSRPLALQRIAPDDSVLGGVVLTTYGDFIQAAFQPKYTESAAARENNFPFFFGLAIESYLATLVSDDAPVDRLAQGQADALTTEQISGLLLFQGQAMCMFCHSGPETTAASFTYASSHGPIDSVLTVNTGSVRMLNADSGFFNTGVRPSIEDSGLDGLDTFGIPYSLAARGASSDLAVDGAFKVPGLRNVEFTGPYFHNGGQATLEQVVAFYSRGGDFPQSNGVPVEITRLDLEPDERAQIVAFLKAFTDDRVRYERAPFDHPELCVPNGYSDDAVEQWAGIPAVGRNGNSVPLQTFEELLQGIGTDGTRAHTLTDACRIP